MCLADNMFVRHPKMHVFKVLPLGTAKNLVGGDALIPTIFVFLRMLSDSQWSIKRFTETPHNFFSAMAAL